MIGNSQAGQGNLSKTFQPNVQDEGRGQAQEYLGEGENAQGQQRNVPFNKMLLTYSNYNNNNFKGPNMSYMPQNFGNYYYNPQMNYPQQGFQQQANNSQNYNPKFYNYNPKYKFKKNQMQQSYGAYVDPNEEMSIMQSLKYVSEKYGHLINLNNESIGLSEEIKKQQEPRFFVIKSFTEEDIHKSIKYSCWSSTKEGNKKLNNIYKDAKKKNSDVFLFFSMNGSGRFVGVCKMTGEVDESKIFEYWAMDEVWKGLMPVQWLFIKDIPNRFLKDIRLSNNGYKPVTNSRDTQEIPRPEGETFVQMFEEFIYQTSLLQHFQYYDERQDLFEKARNSQY